MNELEVMSYILCGTYSTVIKFDAITNTQKIFPNMHKISLKDYKARDKLSECIFVEIEPNNFLYGRPMTILVNSSGRVLSFRLLEISLE